MYEEFFNLSGSPFKLNPDPKFFFGSRSHNKAMAYLHYGLKQAEGFIVITGPIGSGKTMVISQLLDQLNATNVIAAQLLTSNIAPEELLDHILSAFRIEPEGEGRTGKLEAFEDYLFDQLNRGRRVLLIVDEAQNLPFETLEELRMLSNVDYDGTPLFQVFLVGQPEFRDYMQSQRLEQLRQRVIASYHLENLNAAETREYILHRLTVTGWRDDPTFTDDAFEAIFKETGGRPRRINTVVNRVLLYCSLEEEHEVTAEIASTVIEELHEENLQAMDTTDEDLPFVDKMPPVRQVETADETIEHEEHHKKASGDDVVVSFDSARSRNVAGESAAESEPALVDNKDTDSTNNPLQTAEEDTEEEASVEVEVGGEDMNQAETTKAAEEAEENPGSDEAENKSAKETADTEDTSSEAVEAPVAAMSGSSVFDRLRAKRSGEDADERREATLEEVASAIASVSETGLQEHPADADDSDAADMTKAAAIAPLKGVHAKEWRAQVKNSINEARDELKEAHSSVRRLRKSLTEMQRRRAENRKEIVASISRAEAMLNELQDSWQ